MDVLGNDTEHLLLLPVALIFQNELGSVGQKDLSYIDTTTARADLNHSEQSWKTHVTSSEPQKLEKIEDVIRKELKWTFTFHAYGFGCLFFILAFYTFFSILNLRSFISSRPFMSTINGFLCLLGTSRAASLFIDPYNLKENIPRLFGQVLWDLGFPSIISAFSLVQLAFLQFTQLQVGPEGLRKKSCLSLIVTAHFLLTISMDILASSHENLMIAKHVVHYIFLTWGVFLCSNFLYSGYKIMSMIKNLPEGLRHVDLPQYGNKGIMQLAMLAPHNNLAGSMTAAFLPTLCAPKIHQQENTNLSSVGFKNDGNSRILESESIPMLEELIGSSGDEICPKPLVRASSYQNQGRNSKKFNLNPKSHFRSISDNLKDDEFNKRKRIGAEKDQRDHLSKSGNLIKTNESKEFNSKSTDEIFKGKENFSSSRSVNELKLKLEQRTSFENENFCFANENMELQNFNAVGLVPEILVTRPVSASEVMECTPEKALNKLMREISKDLSEMQILREDEANRSEQIVKVHECLRKSHDGEQGSGPKSKGIVAKCHGFASMEKRNTLWEGSKRTNSCSDISVPEPLTVIKSALTANSCIRGREKFDETPGLSQKMKEKRKSKSLSWKKRPEIEGEKAMQECLLQQKQSAEPILKSGLCHEACIHTNHMNSDDDFEKIQKSKMEWVLNITYITAMWGLMLCLSHMGKIYSPFGLPEPRRTASRLNSTVSRDERTEQAIEGGMSFSPWPWLWFQTFCRALELAMGCAMANITRQPTANSRYSRALTFRHRNTFYNI